MSEIQQYMKNGKCQQDSVILGNSYRFTALTSRLVRMEYAVDGIFEDSPTQTVLNRDFPTPEYHVWKTKNGIEIKTEYISIFYDEKEFSPYGLTVENHSDCRGIYCTWHFGDPLNENLGGTARTLDEVDGALPLEPGVLSRLQGYSVMDDSKSFVLLEDGGVEPRKDGLQDIYFFSYGFDFKQALRDFFHLCGHTPLLPRYALGNWWSRFYAYTDVKYLTLMDQFQERGIPLSVSVIDMDWHITKPEGGGKGWTGYTWNKELFPDPKGFMKQLHRRNLKVTLNLHPAEGVQAHEEMYEEMAQALGKDTSRCQRVPFDAGNRAFMEAYFKYLHHPHEEEGVDFWWVDWQQGTTSTFHGLDPLWLLNHYHTLDIARNGKRPLILSRYAGPGSHRYPIGFSGDSVISWASLQFQPYFTATASNIGYSWWSHDIGGHTHGRRDDELQVRWLQFGVFSPIMRMHSTCNLFNGKEPWRYEWQACTVMTEFLRLRNKMLPYLYSMNWRCHTQDEQLLQPMYYEYPRSEEAYGVPNEYYFGSELIVCPVTKPMDRVLLLAGVKVWLPDGIYIDVFNDLVYHGSRMINMYRPLEAIPVLAKAGAIIPMLTEGECSYNGTELPTALDIRIYSGADGAFELYEDDGETMDYINGEYGVTSMRLDWRINGGTEFTIIGAPAKTFLPKARDYILSFICVEENTAPIVEAENVCALTMDTTYDVEHHNLKVFLRQIPAGEKIWLRFHTPLELASNITLPRFKAILNKAQIEYELKNQIYRILTSEKETSVIISNLQTLKLSDELLEAITEILFA